MRWINWREVFKFFSGAAFVGTISNLVLCQQNISIVVPVLGFTISPHLFGVRAIISFGLFCVFFYFGYLRRQKKVR